MDEPTKEENNSNQNAENELPPYLVKETVSLSDIIDYCYKQDEREKEKLKERRKKYEDKEQ